VPVTVTNQDLDEAHGEESIIVVTNQEDTCLYNSSETAPPLPGKKGIGFLLQEDNWMKNIQKVVALNVSWHYSWGLVPVHEQPPNIEFIPMVWGGWTMGQELDEELQTVVDWGAKRIMGFNEPDKVDQANMDLELALQIWPQLEATGLPLVSPSCAHPERSWMKDFMTAARENCHRIDYVGVHWYDSPWLEPFQKQLIEWYALWGKPLIVSEFAPADWTSTNPQDIAYSKEQMLEFMKQALPWMEEQDWISGYAWFSFKPDSPVGANSALFDESGELTTLGRFYASVSPENPYGDQSIVTER
jgi:hypothetical protein